VRAAAQRFRGAYGAGPLHLVGALACFAVIGLAVFGWFEEPWESLKYILIWFLGAVLAHDMVLLPLYTALDRLATLRVPGRFPPVARTRPGPWVYVRVPLILSGLILLVFGAEILREGNATYFTASGQHQNVYLGRYLLIVACLFGLSLLAFLAARLRRGAERAPAEPQCTDPHKAWGTQTPEGSGGW
jgi:hypothetical protein